MVYRLCFTGSTVFPSMGYAVSSPSQGAISASGAMSMGLSSGLMGRQKKSLKHLYGAPR